MTRTARSGDTSTERRLQAERLVGAQALQEAQALRFNVFSGEFNAKLKGAELGLDMDDYDVHCSHIGVRDLNTGRLVATTRRVAAGDLTVSIAVDRHDEIGEVLQASARPWYVTLFQLSQPLHFGDYGGLPLKSCGPPST